MSVHQMDHPSARWFRSQRDVITVTGADCVTFLQGQISADVAGLGVADSAMTLVLSPAGKIDAWGRVTRTAADAVMIDVDAGLGDAVMTRLSRFKIRVDVEMTWEPMSWLAVRGQQFVTPRPAGVIIWCDTFWPGVVGTDVVGAPEVIDELIADQLDPVSEMTDEAFTAARVVAGVPVVGLDVDNDTIPAEAGAWLIDASVSFTKGCYVGQELVARIDSRGNNTPRRLRALVATERFMRVGDTLSAGAESSKSAGTLSSVAWSDELGVEVALALVPRGVEDGARVMTDRDGQLSELNAEVRSLPLR